MNILIAILNVVSDLAMVIVIAYLLIWNTAKMIDGCKDFLDCKKTKNSAFFVFEMLLLMVYGLVRHFY